MRGVLHNSSLAGLENNVLRRRRVGGNYENHENHVCALLAMLSAFTLEMRERERELRRGFIFITVIAWHRFYGIISISYRIMFYLRTIISRVNYFVIGFSLEIAYFSYQHCGQMLRKWNKSLV